MKKGIKMLLDILKTSLKIEPSKKLNMLNKRKPIKTEQKKGEIKQIKLNKKVQIFETKECEKTQGAEKKQQKNKTH